MPTISQISSPTLIILFSLVSQIKCSFSFSYFSFLLPDQRNFSSSMSTFGMFLTTIVLILYFKQKYDLMNYEQNQDDQNQKDQYEEVRGSEMSGIIRDQQMEEIQNQGDGEVSSQRKINNEREAQTVGVKRRDQIGDQIRII